MPQYSYHERDYAFGQAMLALHTSIGLTPAGPAVLLGISQRAIDEWENSLNYFKRDSPQYDVRPLNASLSTQYRCKTLVSDEHLGSNVGEASRASPSRNEQRILPLPDFAERSGLLDNGSTPLHAACLRGMPGSHLLALLCQGPRQYKSVFQGMRRPLPELEWGDERHREAWVTWPRPEYRMAFDQRDRCAGWSPPQWPRSGARCAPTSPQGVGRTAPSIPIRGPVRRPVSPSVAYQTRPLSR
jgi:hypothetical protein